SSGSSELLAHASQLPNHPVGWSDRVGESASARMSEQQEDPSTQEPYELDTHDNSISIMCVGESGLGKTSLLASLFQTELTWPNSESSASGWLAATGSISEIDVPFDLDGVPYRARLIDTPGFGEGRDVWRTCESVVGRDKRNLSVEREDQPVDVVLYFFAPHRCKASDMKILARLKGKVSIVPILAKADTMTKDELALYRAKVRDAVQGSTWLFSATHIEHARTCLPFGFTSALTIHIDANRLIQLKEITKQNSKLFSSHKAQSRQGSPELPLSRPLHVSSTRNENHHVPSQPRAWAVKISPFSAVQKLQMLFPRRLLGKSHKSDPDGSARTSTSKPAEVDDFEEPPEFVPPPPGGGNVFSDLFSRIRFDGFNR
ncbi:MAG: hypothetical protein SGPRY_001908, partial [Prymnesium sp.]